MDDVIANYVSAQHIQQWSIAANVIAAIFIGPYLAFAATPEAGFKCLQAFVRLVHRVLLVGFSIALLNNALVIIKTDRVPTGSGLALNLLILGTVICSALRYHWWMADIPKNASWRFPQFTHRETEKRNDARHPT
jgi:hypothetical protein